MEELGRQGRLDPGKIKVERIHSNERKQLTAVKETEGWKKDDKAKTQDVLFRIAWLQPKVSNTNSLLTLNSNALPTESFVTPFADWRGFFKERMPLYLPLPPGHTSSSVALLFKPSAFLFLSSATLLIFFLSQTHSDK